VAPGVNDLDLILALVLLGLVGLVSYRMLPERASLRPEAWSDWKEAQHRAETLLRSLLTEAEYQQLNRYQYLDVRSPSRPTRIYRVPRHKGQVKVYEAGMVVEALCIQAVEPIPDGDTVLMHKLMIEGNEDEYLRAANHFDLAGFGFLQRPPRR
jgi:hypothetical protein